MTMLIFPGQSGESWKCNWNPGVVVVSDLTATCIDIDFRAAGLPPPSWAGILSSMCLALYAPGFGFVFYCDYFSLTHFHLCLQSEQWLDALDSFGDTARPLNL